MKRPRGIRACCELRAEDNSTGAEEDSIERLNNDNDIDNGV